MEFGSRFTRLRPGRVPSATNPDRLVADWSAASELEVIGFLDSASADEKPGASREEVVSSATLYIDDVSADIARHDRITDGVRTWTVEGFPAAPINPFDGWQPYLVVALKEVVG